MKSKEKSFEAEGMSKVSMVKGGNKIRFSEQIEMLSHLYKLIEAPVKKFIGKGTGKNEHPEATPGDFIDMGHAHIFRTLDSEGNTHVRSASLCGHYHMIELKYNDKNPEEAPEIVAMSGPMQLVPKKIKGKTVMVDEPVNHYDFHTHNVEYLKSEKIHARQKNTAAQLYIANKESQKPSAPVGAGEVGGR